MKDEEMAEEFLKKNNYTNGYIGYFASGYCKQAFLAGLKAGRPQWHDLRKDQNDLPKSSPFHEVLGENGMKMYYDDVLKKWNMFTQNGIVQARPPIAWCEIPTFDKE